MGGGGGDYCLDLRGPIISLSHLSISLSFARNSSCLIQERHSSRKSSATHSHRCVQCFGVQTVVRLPEFRILKCTQMLMHVTAPSRCTDTVGESALKADSGQKIPCHTGDFIIALYKSKKRSIKKFFFKALYKSKKRSIKHVS